MNRIFLITILVLLFGNTFAWMDENSDAYVTNNMVLIKGGTFMMGSPNSEPGHKEFYDQEIYHKVEITKPYYISKYEVTFDEYDEYCDKVGIARIPDEGFGRGKRPVINVSWYDAVAYCIWRNQMEGLESPYEASDVDASHSEINVEGIKKYVISFNKMTVECNWKANGYRLPTSAEWEFACRAWSTTPFNTGNNITTDQANYNGDEPYNNNPKGIHRKTTLPVGSFPPNKFGLYDMHGNVWELCWDRWEMYPLPFEENISINPKSSDENIMKNSDDRAVRGGSWDTSGVRLRSGYTNGAPPNHKSKFMGFRLARSAKNITLSGEN